MIENGASVDEDSDSENDSRAEIDCDNESNPDEIRNNQPSFEIISVREQNIRKFRTMGRDYKIRVGGMERGQSFDEILFNLSNMFAELLAMLLREVQQQDRVRLIISGQGLRHISLPFMPPDQLTIEKVMTELEKVTQSNDAWLFEGDFFINFIHVRLPVGGGYLRGIASMNQRVKQKRCFIEIENKDELCLARSIVTAKARLFNDDDYIRIRKGRPIQRILAEDLHAEAGVPKAKCGLNELQQFQNVLVRSDIQLIVFSSLYFNCVCFKGPPAKYQINLYHYGEHFAPITKMPAFLERSYYCKHCNKGYNNDKTHICTATCACCKSDVGCQIENWVNCKTCNRVFKSENCFQNHLEKNAAGNSVCNIFKKCVKCFEVFDSRNKHYCDKNYCKTCGDYRNFPHDCFIPKPKSKNKKKSDIINFLYYDFESTQEKDLENGNKEHVPNLCVAHRCCNLCGNDPSVSDSICDFCDRQGAPREEQIFSGQNTVEEFCTWVFNTSIALRRKREETNREKNLRKKNGTTNEQDENEFSVDLIALAHNSRGYDSFFIFQYLHAQGIKPINVIQIGQKVLSFEANGVKFIDSLSFLPIPLKSFPKTFNVEELKKGFFPHLFNTSQNQEYVGKIPDTHYFTPNQMSEKDRNEFFEWYKNQTDKIYNFKNELTSYCQSDVNILRRCCTIFMHLFESQTGINPFKNSVTIASACNRVYREMFMEPNSIAVLPPFGKKYVNNSVLAEKWLEWTMKENKIKIHHAGNGGEKYICGYKVDGVDLENKTIYEFNGCFWHGCEKCYPNRQTLNTRVGKTMETLHENTIFRRNALIEAGYTVIEKRECTFNDEIKKNPNLKEFTTNIVSTEPLNPREAFFGGRTNAIKLHHKCNEYEKIKYVDFTSLYPWVCKYQHYPMGHPNIIKGVELDGKDPLTYEGLIKCKVLPPRKLYLPVLPMRLDNKLKFALCSSCAKIGSKVCNHNEEERSLVGTWVIFELKKAIEMGYKLLETYEIWHFEETTQYDSEKSEGGLFAGYINKFLKIKQESSGWPSWCTNDEQKLKYIADYEKNEGIKLDKSNISFSPGLRSISKLCLNSLWGKFGQRPCFMSTLYTDNPEEFISKLTDDSIDVSDVQLVNDEFVSIKYKEKEEFVQPCSHTNTVIAAYTTAHARLKLYSELEKLNSQVLYFDTDSVIYVVNEKDKNHYDPPLGDYLGEFKDELDGQTIDEYVSGGPKNYAYKIKETGETVCKVRGFTLNYNNSQRINFESMKDLVKTLDFTHKIVIENPFKIKRVKDFRIVTANENKKYGLVYDKRYLYNDFFTRPYGF